MFFSIYNSIIAHMIPFDDYKDAYKIEILDGWYGNMYISYCQPINLILIFLKHNLFYL